MDETKFIRKLQKRRDYFLVELPIYWLRNNGLDEDRYIEIDIKNDTELTLRPMKI